MKEGFVMTYRNPMHKSEMRWSSTILLFQARGVIEARAIHLVVLIGSGCDFIDI
jgi:hypothetical protein